MDIRKYAVEETGVVELVDASDDPMIGDDGNRMTITVYGPGSKQYAKAQAANSNKQVDRLKKKGKMDQTAEQKARESAEFLAACTKEFSPNITYGEMKGDDLFIAVYSDKSVGFIADQVAAYIAEWGNFTKGSPKP